MSCAERSFMNIVFTKTRFSVLEADIKSIVVRMSMIPNELWCNGRIFSSLYRAILSPKQHLIQARSAGCRQENPRKANMALIVIVKPQDGEALGDTCMVLQPHAVKSASTQKSCRGIQARMIRNALEILNTMATPCALQVASEHGVRKKTFQLATPTTSGTHNLKV